MCVNCQSNKEKRTGQKERKILNDPNILLRFLSIIPRVLDRKMHPTSGKASGAGAERCITLVCVCASMHVLVAFNLAWE